MRVRVAFCFSLRGQLLPVAVGGMSSRARDDGSSERYGRLYGMVSDRSSRVRRIRSSRTAERSETAEGRDRDDIPPNRDYAIDIIAYESFRELDLVGRMGVAMLSNLFRVDIFGRLAVSFGVRW